MFPKTRKIIRALPFWIVIFFATCSNTVVNQDLTGHWKGIISCNGKSLDIFFDITGNECRYDIPGLGLFGQEAEDWEVKGSGFSFTVRGKEDINVTGKVNNGEITAAVDEDESILLRLQRTSNEPELYNEEELNYESNNAVISGTLIKPVGAGPYPVIVFVHGSGKMTRETMRSRAIMFVRNGSAVYIFDRRGKGASQGDTSRILPISVMTEDVINAVETLKQRMEIDEGKIGLYGISQGGWVVPNAASMCSDIDFIITVSAPGITPDEQNTYTVNNVIQKQISKVYEKSEWGKYLQGENIQWQDSSDAKPDYGDTEIVKGFSWFDPAPVWEKVTIPVLAVWGSADELVPPEESMSVIQNSLSVNGNKQAVLKIFDGADHSLRLTEEKDKFAGKWMPVAEGSNEFIIAWFSKTVLKK